MQGFVAGLCGVVFGAGLAVSGMTDPRKVLAFLDVFGVWDPTLALVMAGALGTAAAGFALARGRVRPWLAEAFSLPGRRDLDAGLLGGAALFGVGWGLVGLCPGPALANLSRPSREILLFVGSMVAGAAAYRLLRSRRAGRKASGSSAGSLAGLPSPE